MKSIADSKSILVLEKISVEKLYFERLSDAVHRVESTDKISFYHNLNKMEDQLFRVRLGVVLNEDGKYRIEVEISGLFRLSEDSVLGKKILENNTVAILFPYLRSQLTLLSSQPDFEPIILPALNINALLNEEWIILDNMWRDIA